MTLILYCIFNACYAAGCGQKTMTLEERLATLPAKPVKEIEADYYVSKRHTRLILYSPLTIIILTDLYSPSRYSSAMSGLTSRWWWLLKAIQPVTARVNWQTCCSATRSSSSTGILRIHCLIQLTGSISLHGRLPLTSTG